MQRQTEEEPALSRELCNKHLSSVSVHQNHDQLADRIKPLGVGFNNFEAMERKLCQPPALACTRVLYVAKHGTIITGRSMDWGEDLQPNMWVLPRGMTRDGMGGKNSISWVSKYGSLVVSAYDIGTSEGMNEKGLVVKQGSSRSADNS